MKATPNPLHAKMTAADRAAKATKAAIEVATVAHAVMAAVVDPAVAVDAVETVDHDATNPPADDLI